MNRVESLPLPLSVTQNVSGLFRQSGNINLTRVSDTVRDNNAEKLYPRSKCVFCLHFKSFQTISPTVHQLGKKVIESWKIVEN